MKISSLAFVAGINLFLFYAGIIVVPQLMLLAGISIQSFYIFPILGCVISISWYFYNNYLNLESKITYIGILFFSSILALFCFIWAGSFFDTSFDGNWYHQDAMYLLEDGWKPLYKTLTESETSYSQKYLNHFPIASWVSGAFIYTLSGNIECAKGINLMLIFSILGTSFFLYTRLLNNNSPFAFGLALVTAANPILLLNLGNTYADGQVAASFAFIVVFGLLYFKDKNIWLGVLTLLAAAILANLKFTSAIYAFILVSAGLIYLIFIKYYSFIKALYIGIVWGIFTYGILGLSPYINNLVQKGHPFYPVSEGSEKFFNRTAIYPANFLGKSQVHNFFFSLYAEPIWSRNPIEAKIKRPLDPIWLKTYENGMPELAAFGPLSAEIFTLLLPLFVWIMFKVNKKERTVYLVFILAIFTSIFINPEAWVLRYVPQFWLLFMLMLFAIISYSITLTPNKLIWKITCLEILLFCFANSFILGKTAVSGALAFSKEQEEIFQQVKNNPIQNQVFHGWTLTFKNRLGAAGIDTSKIVYLADDDSLSKPIPHSLGGRYKSILK
jgi:hypothetical protein